jgi:spore coat-associated protein N
VNRPATLVKKVRGSRNLHLAALAAGTLAVAGLIGFGGLAAWTVTTQNNGSTFATGTVHHTNLAKVGGAGAGVSCNDTTSPASCGVIFTLAAAKPGSSTTGTVQLTNTGTLPSTFTLTLASATGGTLCNSLNALIVDNEATPATVYNASLSAMGAQSLKASTASATWNTSDTGTYTFTISLPAGSANSDMGQTCTAAYLWTQTNT